MADLVDTNILVYRFDPRDPGKQRIARAVLRNGIEAGTARISHQGILEFIAAVTRPVGRHPPLLGLQEALREAEELLAEFEVLYPDDTILRTAIRGVATYQLSWFDAHMWAYAECHGLERLISEDFEHDRMYGTVRAWNPFLGPAGRA